MKLILFIGMSIITALCFSLGLDHQDRLNRRKAQELQRDLDTHELKKFLTTNLFVPTYNSGVLVRSNTLIFVASGMEFLAIESPTPFPDGVAEAMKIVHERGREMVWTYTGTNGIANVGQWSEKKGFEWAIVAIADDTNLLIPPAVYGQSINARIEGGSLSIQTHEPMIVQGIESKVWRSNKAGSRIKASFGLTMWIATDVFGEWTTDDPKPVASPKPLKVDTSGVEVFRLPAWQTNGILMRFGHNSIWLNHTSHVGTFEASAAALSTAPGPVPTLWTDTNGVRWQAHWQRLP